MEIDKENRTIREQIDATVHSLRICRTNTETLLKLIDETDAEVGTDRNEDICSLRSKAMTLFDELNHEVWVLTSTRYKFKK